MRRSICFTEPPFGLAGQMTTWRFIYTPSSALSKGAKLKFDLLTLGRDIDWQVPSVDLKKGDKDNVIYALLPDDKILEAKEVKKPNSWVPQYEFTLSCDIEAGEEFVICLGTLPDSKGQYDPKKGNGGQTYVQRRRPFHLYVDPDGKGLYDEPEVFSLDVRGNRLHHLRVIAPSYVLKNKRFDVTVRFEDEFGNLTAHAPEDTLIELSYDQLRENLNWKLFVPETGFITLPNLYFNEAGIYILQLRNLTTGESFQSAPIKCFLEHDRQLFWGLLHGESPRVDSVEQLDAYLRYFRDDSSLNFFGISPFEEAAETSNDQWKLASQAVADYNEDDRFSTFLGFQWVGDEGEEGCRHFFYCKDGKSLLRRKEAKNNALKKIYKHLNPKEGLSIPSFTMGSNSVFDFSSHDPEFERVVEIYNAWGSSECTAKEGNPRPIKGPVKTGVKEDAKGSIRRALNQGARFGFVAGGLDDRGIYQDFYEDKQEQYTPGLTAVLGNGHNRQAMFDAVAERCCYATTGEKIVLGFEIIGAPMGQEISVQEKPGLLVNRHITGFVAGTDLIECIEIIRNGEVIHKIEPKDEQHVEFTYDDMEALEDISLTGPNWPYPFTYYYMRVIQKDGHMAWGSPIWVDITPEAPKRGRKPKEKEGK